MQRIGVVIGVCLMAATALAHQGVTNPAVMARMSLMSDIAAQTKVLGQMVKGATPFDAVRAREAKNALVLHANAVSQAFAAPEMDPKTEALPKIWADAPGFLDATQAFERATQNLDVISRDGLSQSFRAFGASCGACHADYRK